MRRSTKLSSTSTRTAAAAKKAEPRGVPVTPAPATERVTDSKREHKNLQTCGARQANVCAWGRIQNLCKRRRQRHRYSRKAFACQFALVDAVSGVAGALASAGVGCSKG